MRSVKLFKNGHSQAVRLPKEFRFEGEEIWAKKIGNSVILLPKSQPWQALNQGIESFSDDFLAQRNQPPLQERDDL